MSRIEQHHYNRNGINWYIRNAEQKDAKELIELIPLIDSETEFMLRSEGEFNMSLEDEEIFINSAINKKNQLLLVAEVNSKIVGVLNFQGNNLERYKHQGKFAMGILKSYWNKGIGSSLMTTMLNWCNKNKIVRISLEVIENNERGIRLYKKFKFREEGRLKKDCYYGEGKYIDTLIMAYLSI